MVRDTRDGNLKRSIRDCISVGNGDGYGYWERVSDCKFSRSRRFSKIGTSLAAWNACSMMLSAWICDANSGLLVSVSCGCEHCVSVLRVMTEKSCR
jgi:hypothetical protein